MKRKSIGEMKKIYPELCDIDAEKIVDFVMKNPILINAIMKETEGKSSDVVSLPFSELHLAIEKLKLKVNDRY